MRRVVWIWGPALTQMGLIFGASAIPNLTRLPGDLSDHSGHFVGYAMLGVAMLRACAGAEWNGLTARAASQAWVLSVLYAASDEFHQRFVEGRTPAVDDWVADALGAAAAIIAVSVAAAGRRLERPDV
ncbi:MAG: VanZ family protein [Vicinamibacterales bacterium]